MTLETLKNLQTMKTAASSARVANTVAKPVLEAGRLSTLEALQFKKYLRENSGMTGVELEEYLDKITKEERAELIQSFRQSLPPVENPPSLTTVKVAGVTSIASMPVATAAPVVMHVLSENANQPTCPKCGSTKTTFSKQGFGVGKAAIGVVLTGGIGLLAGGIGKNKILLTCLHCGHGWKVG